MTKSYYVQIVLMSVVLAVVTTSGLSQIATTKEQQPNGNLEVFAVMNSASVCMGTDHLSVHIVITNKSGEPVELDISRLSTTAGFVALIDTTDMHFRTETLGMNSDPVGKAGQPAITLLPPKGFFEREIHLRLRDPFFSRVGFYRLNLSSSVRVGQSSHPRDVFSSSSTIFELRACELK